MKTWTRAVLLLALAATMPARARTEGKPIRVRVIGDRVSLRARPGMESELLDRAMKGDELVLLGRTNGWIAVRAPDTIDLWVAGEFVEEGVVRAKQLNVRSGPNLNYSVICRVRRNDRLKVRGEFNGWLKIAPPRESKAWISGKYVKVLNPPKPKPKPKPKSVKPAKPKAVKPPKPAPSKPVVPELTEAEMKPLLMVLDKSREQGVYDEIPGVLRRSYPGLFKLTLPVGDAEETICLVRGNPRQLSKLLGRSMLLKGKTYWIEGVDVPVIKPEKIHLDPLLAE